MRVLTREEAKQIDVDFIYNMGNVVGITSQAFIEKRVVVKKK